MENRYSGKNNNTIRVTLVNRSSSRLSQTSNFKYENKGTTFFIDKSTPTIKKVISIAANPMVINYNLIQTPDSITTTNAEGTLLTGAKMGINARITQSIEYEGNDGDIYNISKEIPFSTYIVLTRDFDFNKIPSINIIVEDIQLEIKDGSLIIENISVFVEVF